MFYMDDEIIFIFFPTKFIFVQITYNLTMYHLSLFENQIYNYDIKNLMHFPYGNYVILYVLELFGF